MRPKAGHLRVKRYKARQRHRVWIFLGAMVLLWGMVWGGFHFLREPLTTAFFQPRPTLSPEEMAWGEENFTWQGKTWYVLQLGAFEKREAAQEAADYFMKRGAAGCIFFHEGMYRVLAAAYPSRLEAAEVQSHLKKYHQVNTLVIQWTTPRISLRLSGKQGQIDTVKSALDFLASVGDQMLSWSLRIDKGESSREEVQEAVSSYIKTAVTLREQLHFYFGENLPPLPLQTEKMLDSVLLSLKRAGEKNPSNAALGSRIKYCQMNSICSLYTQAAALEEKFVSTP